MPVLAAQATLAGVPCGSTLYAVRYGALQHRLPSCDSGANGVCLCYCVWYSLDSTGNAGRERSLAWHGVALSSETGSKIGPSCGQNGECGGMSRACGTAVQAERFPPSCLVDIGAVACRRGRRGGAGRCILGSDPTDTSGKLGPKLGDKVPPETILGTPAVEPSIASLLPRRPGPGVYLYRPGSSSRYVPRTDKQCPCPRNMIIRRKKGRTRSAERTQCRILEGVHHAPRTVYGLVPVLVS